MSLRTVSAFAAGIALVLGGLGCTDEQAQSSATPTPPPQPEATAAPEQAPPEAQTQSVRVVEVLAKDLDFEPSSITAAPGETLLLRLVNRGQTRHSIEFHLENDEAALTEPVPPGQSATLSLTAPQSPGTYVYYCPVGDHRAQGMEGQLVVQPAEAAEE